MPQDNPNPAPAENQIAKPEFKPPLLAGGGIGAIIPQDIDQVWRLATIIVKAGMAPKSLDTVEKATVAMIHGMEVGLKPMQSMQSIAVINNMPSIYGDAMLGIVIASPVYGDHVESIEFDDQGNPWQATCSAVRKGDTRWRTQTITRAQAQKAGWWNKQGPWSATPQRMLQMRARGWCLRDTFPDVLRGLVLAEEAEDMVDITPKGSATTTAPPEPKRTDFTKDGPHRASPSGSAKVTDVQHDPQTGEVKEPATNGKPEEKVDPWFAIGTGQEEITASILALVDDAKSVSDVDKIEKANGDRVKKFTQANRAKITVAMENKKDDLGGAA